MDDTMLLSVAIGVFTLMVIGLVLTIREFRNNIIVEEPEKVEIVRAERRPNSGHSTIRRTAS